MPVTPLWRKDGDVIKVIDHAARIADPLIKVIDHAARIAAPVINVIRDANWIADAADPVIGHTGALTGCRAQGSAQ